MKVLHILKTDPDDMTTALFSPLTKAPGQTSTIVRLDDSTDYDALVDLIFAHDKVVSWW